MPNNNRGVRVGPFSGFVAWGLLTSISCWVMAAEPARHQDEMLRGRVVWYGEILQRRLGIQVREDAQQRTLALETPEGDLLPIIEDARGRAFRSDERLRKMQLELWVRRYALTPGLQVLRVTEIVDGHRFQIDYWCDICAIAMYESGPCSCCQQENYLRRREQE